MFRPDGWITVPLQSEINDNKDMQSIYSEFREKVVAMPDAMAVQDGSRALTYEQLDALADTIATSFPTRNPAFVGIVMDHSVEMIASAR